jgi:hypothetical protein
MELNSIAMKNKTLYSILTAILLTGSLIFSACKKEDQKINGTTKVEIRMTDAPGDFDAINLNVKSVVLLSGGKPYTFDVDNGIFNILNFRIGTSNPDIIVASGDMPSGEITEIRLILHDSGNSIVVDGQEQELKTPSAQSSGWKVKLTENPELIPGATYSLLLDFDAAKSIVASGNGKYILKPVVRGITAATSGLISGTVLPIDAHPEILVISDTDTVGTMTDLITGKFTFGGLATGKYKVEIVPVEGYTGTTLTDVSVTAGQNTSLGVTTLQ